jgi:putative transposase
MIWARMLVYITGSVDQELLLRNEYLAAENRILRAKIKGRLLLSDAEKVTLAEIAHRLGRKALGDVAATAKPDTLLGWYRKLIAKKFDGSRFRKSVGRPLVDEEIERLVVRMARENLTWGYDRIVVRDSLAGPTRAPLSSRPTQYIKESKFCASVGKNETVKASNFNRFQ